jgi:Ca2+-binding RTX toxin-like protein
VTQDTGSVNVTFTRDAATPKTATTISDEEQRTVGIDGGSETVSTTSSLSSVTRAEGQSVDYSLSFDTPVTNVDFNINDIDADSVVRVQAFDAAGNALPVMLLGGAGVTLTNTDAVAGVHTADSNGGFADATSQLYSVQVDIAGPVSRVEILHEQNGFDNTSVNITDVFFTAGDGGIVPPVVGGNDELFGDAGDDVIFGEGGNDTIDGGTGADTLAGGEDADLFIGGTAGDVVDGGTDGDDNDTLDLSGSGPLRVVDQTVDEDGDSTSGRIEFLNADGSVSGEMSFAEIENLILPEDPAANTPPVAIDDTLVMDEDTSQTINVLTNDTDLDGDTLILTAASSPTGP